MKILSVECSAGPASAAVIEDGRVLSSAFVNIPLTHSETLMPMIRDVLSYCRTDVTALDGIAVAAGPGSFTGIRIGISAVKGLAAVQNLPCAAVSTLRGMAEHFRGRSCIVCAVMDARCHQVYNALFSVEGDRIERLCEDRALLCEDLKNELAAMAERDPREIIITGDGTRIFLPYVSEIPHVHAANEAQHFQTAVGVGLAAEELFAAGDTVSPDKLLPVYLRLPQAERERIKKQNEEKTS